MSVSHFSTFTANKIVNGVVIKQGPISKYMNIVRHIELKFSVVSAAQLVKN